MRSLRYGLVLEVRKDAIREENGDTVVTDPELERQVRDRFGREPERIYLRRGTARNPFSSSTGGLFRGRMMNQIAQ